MTEEQLKELGLTEEQIPKVMKLKGQAIKTIETERDAAKIDLEKLTEKLNATSEQLAEANKAITGFKDLDVEGIKKAADEYKLAAEKARKEADERVAAVEYDAALKDGISSVKFSSVAARKAILAELKEKGLKHENGKILGLADAIKALQEADKGAFVVDEPAAPAEPAKPPLPQGIKPFQPDGGQIPAANSGRDYMAMLDTARKTGNTQEAVRIKTQAAQEGIVLI